VSELLEREPELEVVDEALGAARGGAGRVVLVEGLAGLGKSTLLEHARRRAEAGGFEVLAARGRELEQEFPFGVARQLFEARLRGAPVAERRTLLDGGAGLAAELLGLEPPSAGARPGEGSPYPLLHGLHWLAANLSERAPLMLTVDDAHWADELSLRFVVYLGARVQELPIAVLVARRPSERGPDAPVLAQLAPEAAARIVRLRPFTAGATRRFVAARAPGAEPAFADACHHATAGNPFMLAELLTALATEGVDPVATAATRVRQIGPAPVWRAVYLALRALPPEATAVARAIAVLGDGSPLAPVAALARLSEAEATRSAAALEGAGLLAAGAPELAFAHPIVGRAIYEELAPAERAAAHRAAVEVLRAADAPAERVAVHALHAGGGLGAGVVEVLRAAAAEALRRGAPAPAARYLRRALTGVDEPAARGELLAELGRAEAAAAEPSAADRLREAMAAGAPGTERRAALARELGNLLQERGAFAEAAATFDRALGELGPEATELRLSLEAGRAAAALWSRAPVPEIRARVGPLVRPGAEPATRAERDLVANAAALEMLAGGARDGAIARAQQAWGGGELVADGAVDDPALWAVAAALAGSEAWEDLAAVTEAIADAARRAGAVLALATAGYLRAYRWLRLGAIDDALAEVDRTLESGAPRRGVFVPVALWVRARCLLERGDVAAAGAALDVSAEEEARFAGSPLGLMLLDARAHVQLAGNDPAAALETWREAGAIAAATGVGNPAFLPWRSGAAVAAARLGDRDAGRELAAAEVEAARVHGSPGALGMALTARGTLERAGAALEWLDEAVATLEGSGARVEHARARVPKGAMLRIAGRRVDARDPLRRGLDLADRNGALVLAARAREELVAAGGRPRRRRLWGVEALTPSERRVAGLVASGMSNREAAEALFVTKKAVEFHLGNVYRKLGVSGRDHLAAALEHADR
jgi:DNA-binding CsgD family transcriptional regulator